MLSASAFGLASENSVAIRVIFVKRRNKQTNKNSNKIQLPDVNDNLYPGADLGGGCKGCAPPLR